MKNKYQGTTVWIVLTIMLVLSAVFLWDTGKTSSIVPFNEFKQKWKDDNVKSVTIKNDKMLVEGVFSDGKEFITYAPEEVINSLIKDYENGAEIQFIQPSNGGMWLTLLPMVLLAVVFMVFIFLFMQQSQGGGGGRGVMNFGRSKAKQASPDGKKVTFDDVAGEEEEKAELAEVVDFLKEPLKYTEMGARIPTGVLLVGPPGTGKTLLAKAVAGEAGRPFFSISGSEFVEMFVGVGASRVRDLFDQAKKNAPCIVFIDEIDAVGRQRGAGYGGGHDEREQTLNQLLVEMDGFGINEGIIVIAATNRPDVLDSALLRPGRFDRQVYVGAPDVKGRKEILKVHTRNKVLEENVDLEEIAKLTAGFTGADLENLTNEAALLAVKRRKKNIGIEELRESITKVSVGPAKKSRVISEADKKLTAYHEAGHAVAMRYLKHSDPVQEISIIPRGMAGGYTMPLPNEDKMYVTKEKLKDKMVELLGGRVAEKLILGDISTGAQNDIERATSIAKSMVMKYGMSDNLGPISYDSSSNDEVFMGRDFGKGRNFSEEVSAKIDKEVRDLIGEAYKRTEKILIDHIDKLHEVAKELLEKETINREEFEAIFDPALKLELEKKAEAKAKAEAEERAKEEAKVKEEKEKIESQQEITLKDSELQEVTVLDSSESDSVQNIKEENSEENK